MSGLLVLSRQVVTGKGMLVAGPGHDRGTIRRNAIAQYLGAKSHRKSHKIVTRMVIYKISSVILGFRLHNMLCCYALDLHDIVS